MNRLNTAILVGISLGTLGITAQAPAQIDAPPNFVVIFTDDQGYGDVGCYGHPTIHTPRLDRMAAEGMRFTQFYSAACVCTPSRAALLTGRLPIRSGMCSDRRRVLFPDSEGGLPDEEITIAEALSEHGYATACIGKWHLGHLPQYLPTRHGFDQYFGIPYSNDMGQTRHGGTNPNRPPLPLMRDEETIETEPDQGLLTERYTQEALAFIAARAEDKKPFFLYLPHTMPHTPLFASERFAGQSARGLYGDVTETIDWSTGAILDALEAHDVADNTLVFFTSDNGPWLIQGDHGGSAGLLRSGKGSTWEGGMRVPAIAWWPSRIRRGRVTQELAATLDLLPTILSIAGVAVPDDRPIDGYDLSPVLFGSGPSPREEMYFYRGTQLFAYRRGPWKAHFKTQAGYGQPEPEEHDPPLLYHLEHDPSEERDVSKSHPDVIAELSGHVERQQAEMKPGKPQL